MGKSFWYTDIDIHSLNNNIFPILDILDLINNIEC